MRTDYDTDGCNHKKPTSERQTFSVPVIRFHSDRINRSLLIKKLQKMKIPNVFVSWITNFHTERFVLVESNGKSSRDRAQAKGVPQGSILGPLLYLIYVDDLCKLLSEETKTTTSALYADDTACVVSGSTKDEALLNAQHVLDIVDLWCAENEMALSKTCAMTMEIKTKKKLDSSDSTRELTFTRSVKELLPIVDFVKYLGIHIDNDLRFRKQIEKIHAELKKGISLIRCLHPYDLDYKTLHLVCNAYVTSRISYALESFGFRISQSDIDDIDKQLKKIARLITGCSQCTPTSILMCEADMMLFKQLKDKQIRNAYFRYKWVQCNGFQVLPSYPLGAATGSSSFKQLTKRFSVTQVSNQIRTLDQV